MSFFDLFSHDGEYAGKETWIIVGLGNPGREYAHTRHNVGFEVTDLLAERWHTALTKKRAQGILAETALEGRRVILCQPQTYMNLSGECVRELLRWYRCPADHLLVIYDDIDLPAGKLRVRKNGSAGTHNGMRSIIGCISTQEFPRLRVGTGACPAEWDLKDWVLSRFEAGEEADAMAAAFRLGADCVEDWVRNGIEHAMQGFNRAAGGKA